MTQRPIFMTKIEMLEIVDDMRRCIIEDDSYGGYFNYDAMDENIPEGKGFAVTAAYRRGNIQGQGFMRFVGPIVSEDESAKS